MSEIASVCFFSVLTRDSMWGFAFNPQFGSFCSIIFSSCPKYPALNPLSTFHTPETQSSVKASTRATSSIGVQVCDGCFSLFLPLLAVEDLEFACKSILHFQNSRLLISNTSYRINKLKPKQWQNNNMSL
ncbi:hypothetical protein RchiOBHm_Chr4g0435291 [Rosa chinensis]|uniref:Uncharacterized protein n=1 Tax=Rosa chinensis TaxID=74649 RepID=A0A2P6R1R1_ROSCH|nr:hypothetical protein RchiOBHm_Chr4g0435291 [Rosa chinensis]